MYQEWEEPESFSERMERFKDREAWAQHGPRPTGARVTWRMPAKTRTTDADGLARLLGVSGARARLLLSSGRVQGAYRARKGRNRPWVVPLYRDGATWLPRILERNRGPALNSSNFLSPAEGSVEF